MDPDFDAPEPRSTAMDTVLIVLCVAVGIGCLGLAAVVAWTDVRGRFRWWRIGR